MNVSIYDMLYTYLYFVKCNLISITEYVEFLHQQFLLYPENELLLELEWLSDDIYKSISIVEKQPINYQYFQQQLYEKLKEIYKEEVIFKSKRKKKLEQNVMLFCKRISTVYSNLPCDWRWETYSFLFSIVEQFEIGLEYGNKKKSVNYFMNDFEKFIGL